MKKLLCLVVCSLFLLSGCGSTSYFEASGDYTQEDVDTSDDTTDEASDETCNGASVDASDTVSQPETIFVQVSGAVVTPGVFELKSGSRVYEAIEAAGGMLDTADDYDINQALVLSDGQKIYVYSQGERSTLAEMEESTASSTSSSADSSLININSATIDELKTLPGIGDSKASQIISYRESNGSFSTIEDIKNVNGIGDSIFSQIQSLITV